MPTGWIDFEGDLQPRAFDTKKITDIESSPYKSPIIMHNASIKLNAVNRSQTVFKAAQLGYISQNN